MRALVGVEIRRFAGRRLVRALAALALLGTLVAAPMVFARSNRDVAAATTAARAEALHGYEACRLEAGLKAGLCEQPDLSAITADPRFHLTDLIGVAEGVAGMLIMLGLVCGASFAGADWHHRSIATLLTWEPRRTRVLLAKVAAAAVAVFAAAVALQVLLGAALIPAGVWRGTTEGVDLAWGGDLAGTILRGGAAAALASAIGCAVAMTGRATAAALGSLFAWVAVVEGLIRAGFPGWRRWLLGDNLAAFVGGANPEAVRSALTAGVLLASYTGLAVLLAAETLRRADVS